MKQVKETGARSFFMPAASVLLCAALLLGSCSRDAEGVYPEGAGPEISVGATLPDGLESSARTKAVVDGSTSTTLYFVRGDETASGTWGAYGTSVLTATRAAGTGSQALTFASKQYYLTSGLKTRLTGWYPAATSFSNGTANWTINGTQDILLAAAQSGDKTTAMPALSFTHALTQLQFFCHSENATAVAQWGKIKAIRVLGQRTSCAYTVATGAFAFSGSTSSLSVSGITAATAPVGEASAAVQFGSALMIEPQPAETTRLLLEIDTENKGTLQIALPVRAYEAGKSVKVLLYFQMVDCLISCEPQTTWVATDDVTIADVGGKSPATYPYVQDGSNTIVAKDRYGCADVDSYPTHEAWASTPAHSESSWNANASGFNTVGEIFQVARADVEAVNWFHASGTFDATSNPNTVSSCAGYSEADDARDRGSWRLPTVRELHLIYERHQLLAYPPLDRGYYWAATDQGEAYGAFVVDFQNGGNTTALVKTQVLNNLFVRCVRDIRIRSVSDDYPKTLNGNIIVIEDLAGRADPDTYPMHYAMYATPAHSEETWKTNASGFNTVGRKFQIAKANAVNAAGNTSMIWHVASGTTDATNNATGYSACAAYSEASDRSDVNTWRLPTARELKLIYDRKDELTAAALPSTGMLWTATGDAASSSQAIYVSFANGSAFFATKSTSYYVRCVRDL